MPPRNPDTNDSDTLDRHHQEFYYWIDRNKTRAVPHESDLTERFFVSRRLLEGYFGDEYQTKQIYQAVSGRPLMIGFDDFRKDWICVFAILLSLGKGHAIQSFVANDLSDSKHPYQERPSDFPLGPFDDDFWPRYRQAQWLFFPFELKKHHHQQRVPEDRVLPIINKRRIGRGGCSKIYAIEVHRDYDKLFPVDQQLTPASHKTYALKEYLPGEAVEYYEAEIEGHSQTRSSDAIVSCYGSFKQETPSGPVLSLILEYADRGTLEEFFQNTSQPSTRAKMVDFWRNLQQLALALSDLHTNHLPQLEASKPKDVLLGYDLLLDVLDINLNVAEAYFRRWHQDVKPKNILLFSDNPTKSMPKFKLGDLGLSHFRKEGCNTTGRGRLDAETFGTREYGAPEASRAPDAFASKQIFVSQSTDIWSLGCVLSEALVWSIRGIDGLNEFRKLRLNETRSVSDNQCPGSFHDEIKVLSCVIDTHQNLLEDLRKWDNITPSMIILTEEMLAQVPETRPSARNVWYRIGKALKPSPSKPKNLEPEAAEGSTTVPMPLFNPPHRSMNSPAISSETSVAIPELVTAKEQKSQMPPGESGLNQPDCSSSRQHAAAEAVGSPSRDSKEERDLARARQLPSVDELRLDNVGEQDTHVTEGNAKTLHRNSTDQPQISLPFLSVSDALKIAKSKKDRKPLPDNGALQSLGDRDCVFLVENGSRIMPYWHNVREVLHALAYFVKRFDKNGLDMYRMIDMNKVHAKTSTDLLTHLNSAQDGDVDINMCLTKILGDYGNKVVSKRNNLFFFSKRSKPLVVYVLTTGEWDGNDDAKTPIKTLIDRLNHAGCSRKHVGIQFIHFGDSDSEDGWKRLVELDDELNLSRDIVDAEKSNGNFLKMLAGSINDRYDADGKKTVRKSLPPPETQ